MARAELPGDTEEPTIREFNTSLFPVLIVTLSGDVPERALYNAAQLALFEFDTPTILLMPEPTGGTATGARAAAKEALDAGADLILGPLFASHLWTLPILQHLASWS